MKKTEIKPGRSAAKIGIVFGIIGIVFGILWIVLLLSLASGDNGLEPGVVFLLAFGAMFLVAVVAVTAFYLKSAYGRKRPSLADVEESAGEERRAANAVDGPAGSKEPYGFCPYCGKAIDKDFAYCRYCGKKLP